MNGPPTPQTGQGEWAAAAERSVLVVDDEPSVADLYAKLLADRFDVDTAYGGDPALDVIDRHHDVVLLDRRMPDRTGDEVLEEIRHRNLDCRVAMVTAVEPDLDVIDLAFDDYLVKPVTGDELTEVVDRLVMLTAYRDARLELSSMRVKRNVLAAEMTDAELSNSEEFRQLRADIEALENVVAAIESELDEADLPVANVA